MHIAADKKFQVKFNKNIYVWKNEGKGSKNKQIL